MLICSQANNRLVRGLTSHVRGLCHKSRNHSRTQLPKDYKQSLAVNYIVSGPRDYQVPRASDLRTKTSSIISRSLLKLVSYQHVYSPLNRQPSSTRTCGENSLTNLWSNLLCSYFALDRFYLSYRDSYTDNLGRSYTIMNDRHFHRKDHDVHVMSPALLSVHLYEDEVRGNMDANGEVPRHDLVPIERYCDLRCCCGREVLFCRGLGSGSGCWEIYSCIRNPTIVASIGTCDPLFVDRSLRNTEEELETRLILQPFFQHIHIHIDLSWGPNTRALLWIWSGSPRRANSLKSPTGL